jgi:hypothetical protein
MRTQAENSSTLATTIPPPPQRRPRTLAQPAAALGSQARATSTLSRQAPVRFTSQIVQIVQQHAERCPRVPRCWFLTIVAACCRLIHEGRLVAQEGNSSGRCTGSPIRVSHSDVGGPDPVRPRGGEAARPPKTGAHQGRVQVMIALYCSFLQFGAVTIQLIT